MECKCIPLRGSVSGLFSECVSPTDRSFVDMDGGDTFTVGVVADSREVVGWGRAFYSELPENAPVVRLKLPEPCKAVTCGSNHVLALTNSGQIMAWGWNKFGQIAVDATEKETVRIPTVVKFPIDSLQVVEIAAGGMHSIAVDAIGRVWAWGCNVYGQLGIDSEVAQLHTPMLVTLPSDVRAQHVAAGWAHSTLIATTGKVFTFGWGLYNQLGHGFTHNERRPVVVDALEGLDSKIVQVACGNWHTAALTASGDLYTWGWGKDGQLGHEASISTQVLPRVVNVSSPVASDEAQDVTAVVCGNRFTLALCRDGSVQYWGPKPAASALQEELASSTSPHPGWLPQEGRRVHKVSAGASHIILLRETKKQNTN